MVEGIIRIPICTAAHGRKRLRSSLGGIVDNCIGGSRSALPHSSELSSPEEEYGTVLRTLNWVLPNSADKFRGVIVGNMGTTNHHGPCRPKPRLVGENSHTSILWEDVRLDEGFWSNESGDM
ncbi:hypothetical protein TNCV_1608661 [Trichonephila clavipes]|nr:hypothetical protein TNCV_1608661 [Trichonephila clavipes]